MWVVCEGGAWCVGVRVVWEQVCDCGVCLCEGVQIRNMNYKTTC